MGTKNKNKKKDTPPFIVYFIIIIVGVGWLSEELGIDLEPQRKESRHYEACQCDDDYDTLTLKLRAPEAREEEILDELLALHNLPKDRYKLCATKAIPEFAAYAKSKNGYNYIIYDRTKLEKYNHVSSVGLMGHEIGHHFHSHTSNYDETQEESWAEEIEADEFSGESLYKVGYSLNESASTRSGTSEGTKTHPPTQDQRNAVRRGWLRASKQKIRPNAKELARYKELAGETASAFVKALGEMDFKKAYSLQKIKSWGDYDQFSSEKYFGGITKVEIITPPKAVNSFQKAGFTWIKISLKYLAFDPVNDQCQSGKVYDQYFWLEGVGDHWKIAKARINNSYCN